MNIFRLPIFIAIAAIVGISAVAAASSLFPSSIVMPSSTIEEELTSALKVEDSQSAAPQLTSHSEGSFWSSYVKPAADTLRMDLTPLAYRVTQEDGTERAGASPYDKLYEDGICVDILSGEPLYSSRDKYDSGTGWPSFTQPITPDALTFHEDRSLFGVRTEVRSAIADNHLGHVFNDGPRDRGGLRYCMNGVALKFIPASDLIELGYGDYIEYI